MRLSSLLFRVSTVSLLLGTALFPPGPSVLAEASLPATDSSASEKFQDSGAGLAALLAAHRQAPQERQTIQRLEKAVENGLPDRLQVDWFPDLPVDISALPDGLGSRVTPKSYLPTPATEPQHGWAFSRVTYVYVPTGERRENRLLCRLHYARSGDADLAARMGGLMALAHRTLVAQTGHEAANGTTPFDVWLCRQGQTGGEQWRTNIYFYDLDTARSSIEWIREIVHEYGHQALPAIGGYSAPEYWANGYYGERLITRWMARAPSGAALVSQVWGDFSGWPNFERLLIAPAIALYKKTGPSAREAARTDEMGMRYLIGQVLTFDDKYGGQRLGAVFANLPRFREAKAADFETAIAETMPRQARHQP